jgi:outer membrane protein TolC
MSVFKKYVCTLLALSHMLFAEPLTQQLPEKIGMSCGNAAPTEIETTDKDEENSKKTKGGRALMLVDAIQETLQYQWALYTSQYGIDVQLGLYQQAAGAFDPQFNASITDLEQIDLQGPLGQRSDFRGRVTTTNVSLTKLQRNGATLSFNYMNQNIFNPFTIPCTPPRLDTSIIGFTLQQPLLRNFMYSPTTTLEQTRCIAFQVARLMNLQVIADALAATLAAYWNCVGQKLIYDAFLSLERKLTKFSEVAEALVKEDQRGIASLQQPYANLANAIVNRIQAEQNWVAAYNQLAFLMGRPPIVEQELITCGIELEDFPSTDGLSELDNCCFQALLSQINVKRPDIAALRMLEDSAALNLRSALNSLLPELDLTAQFDLKNTNACRPGSSIFESFPSNKDAEKDYTVGLSLSFPICNNVAKGLVKQQRAALLQAETNTDQLQGQLITQYNTAFSLNNALVRELTNAEEAAKEFEAATTTEIGASTGN